MTKLLVADSQGPMRQTIVDILTRADYEVAEASNGSTVVEMANTERPDLILMDVELHEMSGLDVLSRLREHPTCSDTPVILMASENNSAKGRLYAWGLGVRHYIIKPTQFDLVELSVKVTLREAEAILEAKEAEKAKAESENAADPSDDDDDTLAEYTTRIRTGSLPLNMLLGGGLPLGTLTLIEGTPGAGKSVLCQHMAYETLISGHDVAYFASDNTAEDLESRMSSIGMDVAGFVRGNRLRVTQISEPAVGDDYDLTDSPGSLMVKLAREMGNLAPGYKLVFVDGVTNLASYAEDRDILQFFTSCKRLSNGGPAVVVVTQSHAMDERMLARLRNLCDSYLRLNIERVGAKRATTLEVVKVNSEDLGRANTISFEVLPDVGMHPLAFAKFRA